MERPRASFEESSVLMEAMPSFVLVRARDKDDKPPIMELKDILPNDPDDVRFVMSGDLQGGEIGGVAACWAKVVRSGSLKSVCGAS
jgi:hypothetical protein